MKNQVFGEALTLSDDFENAVIDGILGMGWPDVNTATPVFQNMITQNLVTEHIFSFYFSKYVSSVKWA